MADPTEGKRTTAQTPEPPAGDADLRQQAELFRGLRAEAPTRFAEEPLSGWKKFLYLTSIFFVLLAVIYLLVFGQARRQLIASVGEQWARFYTVEQDEILRLPPPPPQAVKARTVTQVPLVVGPEREETTGVLFLDEQPFGTSPPEEEKQPVAVVPPKTDANREAYTLLTEQSEDIRQLVSNSISEFEFEEWQPVKDNPPEFWIDLVVVRPSDGQKVHMIWSINGESGRIRPLSQAARDWQASRPAEETTQRPAR